MSIQNKLISIDPDAARDALAHLLTVYCTPAFGALPKREIDLLLFETLDRLDLIEEDASIYQLMRDLKVSRAKARGLLFDLEVRRADAGHLDENLRELLAETGFFRDANYFVLEVENPLLQDHLRERVRRLGYLSDTSFNQALVRLPLEAVSALAEEIIPDKERERVRKALIKAGAPDGSFKSVVGGALKTLANKVAGQAGEHVAGGIVDQASDYLGPLFTGAADAVSSVWKSVFSR